MPANPPLVVGIGGSTRPDSLTSRLLHTALGMTADRGAETVAFPGDFLAELPIFSTDDGGPTPSVRTFAETVGRADAVLLASPGYHGGMSGLLKNALDHLELLRGAARPYLDGRPVGIMVNAAGWQACGTALVSLRSAVHALRGWPTPFGVAVNSAEPVVTDGDRLVPRVAGALEIVTGQVMDFVGWRRAAGAVSAAPTGPADRAR